MQTSRAVKLMTDSVKFGRGCFVQENKAFDLFNVSLSVIFIVFSRRVCIY